MENIKINFGLSKKWKIIIWIIVGVSFFVFVPVIRTDYQPSCSLICFPSLADILSTLAVFVWVLVGLVFCVPKLPESRKKYEPFRVLLIVCLAFWLMGYASVMFDYPYSIYRSITYPEISVTSPENGQILKVSNKYHISWTTKNIKPNENIFVTILYHCDASGCFGLNPFPVVNSGEADIDLQGITGKVVLTLHYPNQYGFSANGIPSHLHDSSPGANSEEVDFVVQQ